MQMTLSNHGRFTPDIWWLKFKWGTLSFRSRWNWYPGTLFPDRPKREMVWHFSPLIQVVFLEYRLKRNTLSRYNRLDAHAVDLRSGWESIAFHHQFLSKVLQFKGTHTLSGSYFKTTTFRWCNPHLRISSRVFDILQRVDCRFWYDMVLCMEQFIDLRLCL